MIIRNVLQNDIVEDIELYRKIMENYVILIKSIKEDYELKFTFDEFYIKVIENFEDIDENFDYINNKSLIDRMIKAIKKVLYEDLEYNEKYIKIVNDAFESAKNK
jgi:flagellar biosynthesis/type III secretory pathway protein FliH